jgi:hypothetical protein
MSNELFFEPKTEQYGSHMVMTNVSKNKKKKYINIDTKFRDEYNYSQAANYNITLPERITEVTSMKVVSAEVPMSFYNISESLGNNFFYITYINAQDISNVVKITIVDGYYNNTTLVNATLKSILNSNFEYLNIYSVTVNTVNSYYPKLNINLQTQVNPEKYIFNFATNKDGTNDKYNFKYKLGWILGFRNPTYTLNTGSSSSCSLIPEAFMDTYGPKYLYLAIEEFNKGNQSSFITPVSKSLLNKNIIARITMNRNGGFDYGSVLSVNNFIGLLSDTRSYTGKIDLMKLNVQLLTENGSVVNLNGLDFSFCLEVTHE